MSLQPSVDPTRLCQIEIQVSDLKQALRFYECAFGWRAAPAELHEYVVLDVPDHCPFGISLVPGKAAASSSASTHGNMVLYFAVDDPEKVVVNVVASGGKKRFGPVPLLGYGEIYQVEDPDGTRFGFYVKKGLSR